MVKNNRKMNIFLSETVSSWRRKEEVGGWANCFFDRKVYVYDCCMMDIRGADKTIPTFVQDGMVEEYLWRIRGSYPYMGTLELSQLDEE